MEENSNTEALVKWPFHYFEGLCVFLSGMYVAGSLGYYLQTGRVTELILNVPPEDAGIACGVLLADMAVRKYTGRGLTERTLDTTGKIIDKFYTFYSKIRNK